MNIDGITRTEITHRKKIIVLHDQHIVSFRTARWLLDVIGRGVYEVDIEKYTEVEPFKFITVKCPCAIVDGVPCTNRLNINDFFDTVNKHMASNIVKRNIFKKIKISLRGDIKLQFLNKVHEQLIMIARNKNREIYKKEHSMSDCPKCIDSVDLVGLGKQIPPRSNNQTVDVHQCQTCQSIYCVKCSALFDVNEIHDHTLLTCVDYAKLQSHLQVTKYVKCPKCNIKIGKNEGCNHMTCSCKTQFCFVCGIQLNSDTTETHFTNDGDSPLCQQFDSHYSHIEFMIAFDERIRSIKEATDEYIRIIKEPRHSSLAILGDK